MARFYDPKDETDLARVESILKGGAIEYFLREGGINPPGKEIHVAEEDIPRAEELLRCAAAKR